MRNFILTLRKTPAPPKSPASPASLVQDPAYSTSRIIIHYDSPPNDKPNPVSVFAIPFWRSRAIRQDNKSLRTITTRPGNFRSDPSGFLALPVSDSSAVRLFVRAVLDPVDRSLEAVRIATSLCLSVVRAALFKI